jgi:hypothetical protein
MSVLLPLRGVRNGAQCRPHIGGKKCVASLSFEENAVGFSGRAVLKIKYEG